MFWEKIGQIFVPDGTSEWMASHATHPVAEKQEGHVYKIYFTCRDKQNRSTGAFVLIDIRKPQEILEVSQTPVITAGEAGYFDDSGCQISCLVSTEAGSFLYYLGWNLGVTVPFRNSIGLAIREKEGSPFKKYSLAPIVDRDSIDPLTMSYPWVLHEKGIWRMWYGSHLSWKNEQFEMIHNLRYAESTDGIHWAKSKEAVLSLDFDAGEFAISRPCVIHHEGLYRMWFSSRYQHYQMGYAESADGFNWQRSSRAILANSTQGWDSESVEYASVFRHDGKLFMLYNGNNYGKTGFGLAVQCT